MDSALEKFTTSFFSFLKTLIKYRLANLYYENPCIVLDVDGVLISENPMYNIDTPIAGSIDFTCWCADNDIPMYIITNRKTFDTDNMKKLGFPDFRGISWNANEVDVKIFKKNRRDEISEGRDIIFSIGDNLHDIGDGNHGEPILIPNPYNVI